MKSTRLLGTALLTLLSAAASAVVLADAVPAGSVVMLTGRGTASAQANIRALAKGDPVYGGDIVQSSAASYVDLKFSDGGYFLLRPNSRFQVVDYANHAGTTEAPIKPQAPAAQTPAPAPLAAVSQDNSGGASRAVFRLLKGGFRSISGLIGKINHDEYQVTTPVATIGIRGTDYLAVICDASCAIDPVIATVLPPGVSAIGGIVTTVYAHAIVVNDAGGSVTLLEGQYLLVLPDGTNILLPMEPHFLHIDPIPNPASCAAG